MSVFWNGFDQFGGCADGLLPDVLGGTAPDHHCALAHAPDAPPLADAWDADPLAWAWGLHDGAADVLAAAPGGEVAPADAPPGYPVFGPPGGPHCGFAGGLPVGFEAGLGGSPADHWLSGHEFHGHFSHGTIDTSGQGNHCVSVGGLLELPT